MKNEVLDGGAPRDGSSAEIQNVSPAIEGMFVTRRTNLRKLVHEKFEGNQSALSRVTAIHQNQINLLLTDNKRYRRNLGEALARRLESKLSLPHGWMDTEHGAKEAAVIQTMAVPPEVSHIFREDDQTVCVGYHQAWLDKLPGKYTSVENLRLTRIATHDMAPEIAFDEQVLLDLGATAVTTDGIYVIVHGADAYLRRVSKQLSGGYLITAPGSGTPKVEMASLKGLKGAGRIIATFTTRIL